MLRRLSLWFSPSVAALSVAAVFLAPLGVGSWELGIQTATAPATAVTGSSLDSSGVLAKYCVTCHNEKAKTGGLALDVVARGSVRDHAPVWEAVLRKMRAGAMPPPGMPRPDAKASATLMSTLATELDGAPRDPGRPLLRRLNRAEYGNAIRDLLALDVDVRSLLPIANAPGSSARGIVIETGPRESGNWYAGLRAPRWKYVEHSTGERELYDLNVDPFELSSVHADPRYAQTRQALAARLAVLRTCAGAVCRQWTPVPGPAEA